MKKQLKKYKYKIIFIKNNAYTTNFSFINDSIIDKIVEKDQDLVYNNKVECNFILLLLFDYFLFYFKKSKNKV